MSHFNINQIPNAYFNEAIYLNKLKGNNTFIQTLICSFHDYDNLYFVSKFYDGFVYNYLNDCWNEKMIQFFSACLIQSFTNLRKQNLIHRDVHFGNLVLDEKQYINLIDFHIVMEYRNKDNPKGNVVGSLELCAPEMMRELKYDYNSDYYRLGGMMYYAIFKQYPNYIKKQNNISEIYINYNIPNNYSLDCIDFINKLLISDNHKRIGFNDINELKNHNFFKNFNWEQLITGKMQSPFPKIQRRSLGLCQTLFKFKKKIFLNTKNINYNRVKNIFFIYDNINNDVFESIYSLIK